MSRNFSKYKNKQISSKCVSSKSPPYKARTVTKDLGNNKDSNIVVRKVISYECGKKNSSISNKVILFNIDAPTFIPNARVHPANNIYAQVYIKGNIKEKVGKYTNNAGVLFCIWYNSESKVKGSDFSVNELHKGFSPDSSLVNNTIKCQTAFITILYARMYLTR